MNPNLIFILLSLALFYCKRGFPLTVVIPFCFLLDLLSESLKMELLIKNKEGNFFGWGEYVYQIIFCLVTFFFLSQINLIAFFFSKTLKVFFFKTL